jgi:hypothetical protein
VARLRGAHGAGWRGGRLRPCRARAGRRRPASPRGVGSPAAGRTCRTSWRLRSPCSCF